MIPALPAPLACLAEIDPDLRDATDWETVVFAEGEGSGQNLPPAERALLVEALAPHARAFAAIFAPLRLQRLMINLRTPVDPALDAAAARAAPPDLAGFAAACLPALGEFANAGAQDARLYLRHNGDRPAVFVDRDFTRRMADNPPELVAALEALRASSPDWFAAVVRLDICLGLTAMSASERLDAGIRLRGDP